MGIDIVLYHKYRSINKYVFLIVIKKQDNNMEGAVAEVDKSAFVECLALPKKNPYILQLAFTAGIGGLLYGYDTGKLSYHNVLFLISLICFHF